MLLVNPWILKCLVDAVSLASPSRLAQKGWIEWGYLSPFIPVNGCRHSSPLTDLTVEATCPSSASIIHLLYESDPNMLPAGYSELCFHLNNKIGLIFIVLLAFARDSVLMELKKIK